MIIYPAVDIRDGRCVQLTQGRPDSEVVYDEDPVAQARRWRDEGAQALHVVNLDGTLAYPDGGLRAGDDPAARNLRQVRDIRAAVGVPVQFAGGLRSEADLEVAMDLGVDRVVIGTAAVLRPELVGWALGRWGPDRVGVAVEVNDGVVVSHGWQRATSLRPDEFGARMYDAGVRWALYTDVSREGLLGGANVAGAVALSETTGLRIVISGGVAGVDDIRACATAPDAITGVIIGQALYTGRLTLPDALKAAE
jgi:phosphoribosylformimino-5-aminoimidazole carboxamide ribotide isomerase